MSDNRKNVKSNTKPNTKQNIQKNRPANANNNKDNNSVNQFMEEVMRKVRDFCDRLRDDKPFATKVSIGAVAVLLLLIVIISVSCGKKDEKAELPENGALTESGTEADQSVSADGTQTDGTGETTGETQVSPIDQINAMLGRYFDALSSGDTDTIASLKSEITEEEIIKEQKKSNYVEKFDNINVLTKDGPTADTYVSFVYYEIKFKDIETMAPGLITLYIYKDEAGEYKIFNGELEDAAKEFIKGVAAEEDVVEIFKRVDVKYNEATDADPALKAFMDTFPTTLEKEVSEALAAAQQPTEEQPAEQQPAEEQPAEQAPVTEKVVATDTVNVRSSDSENADKLGKLEAGTKVTRYEAKENGWSKIDYEGKEAYVKSEFLKAESADAGNTEQQEGQTEETQTNNDSSEYESVEGKVVILDTVNVRKSGNESSEKLGVAYKGEYYKLLMKQADGWTKIEFNGKKGFVKSEYVK